VQSGTRGKKYAVRGKYHSSLDKVFLAVKTQKGGKAAVVMKSHMQCLKPE